MPYHEGLQGVWAVYSMGNDGSDVVQRIGDHPVPMLRSLASYEQIFFWPHGTAVSEALDWWHGRKELPDNKKDDEDIRQALHDAIFEAFDGDLNNSNLELESVAKALGKDLMGRFYIRRRYS